MDVSSKKLLLFFVLIFIFSPCLVVFAGENQVQAQLFSNRLPLSFVENRGQWPGTLKYHLRAAKMDVFFTPQQIVFYPFPANKRERFRLTFPGANEHVTIEGRDKTRAKFTFFQGRNPQKKKTGTASYHKLIYREIYPHIDLIICSEKGQIKTEFRVKKGGDPGQIAFQYEGVNGITIDADGRLEIKTAAGKIKEDVPFSFQVVNHRKVKVESAYVIDKNNRVKFKLGEYKRDRELIIDPLIYSTFLGSQGKDNLYDSFLDGNGNIFLTGDTEYPDFLQGDDDVHYRYRRGREVFVVKLNPSANEILFATFISGMAHESGHGIEVDGNGNVYVLGTTNSVDFPITTGAYDESYNVFRDLFLVKLDPSGTELLYSSYLGGEKAENALGIKLIGEGMAVITGFTLSPGFPVTAGAFDTSFNSGDGIVYSDVFIAVFDFESGTLVYSTFLGGTDIELLNGMAVDHQGNVYVTGVTSSPDFPVTPGAFKTIKGSPQNAFVTKMNPSLSKLVYSTFLGGNEEREIYTLQNGCGIFVDREGYAYITGHTECLDFPTTPGAFDREHSGGRDAFVVKLGPSGSELVFSTFLGGNPSERSGDSGYDICVDEAGNIYVTGDTVAYDFPVTGDALSPALQGTQDAFLTIFNPTGTDVLYSTYLGGGKSDYQGNSPTEEAGMEIFLDKGGNIYITGFTFTYDFPITPDAVDPFYGSKGDMFLCKISINLQVPLNFKGRKMTVPVSDVR